MMRVAPDMEWI